jgi:ATP-dependent RNA circularization protein (DNA/RNA ligase family)
MEYCKYPRTYHLPWSLGSTSDDKFLEDTSTFEGEEIIVTEKMDGENTSLYADKYHARSIDSKDHDSRHWVKGLWGRIKHEIPDRWRICGENLFAKHSIYYDNLETYFQVFSIWDENNKCISWDETTSICDMIGLTTVPVICRIKYDEDFLKNLANNLDLEKKEGYVIRNVKEFHYDEFSANVAKWVRPKHVTTDQHWMFSAITPNRLKNHE